MRAFSPELTAHLASGATRLCACWRIKTRAGVSLGFTDHDRDIEFDGLVFEAASGFTASGIDQSLGLAIDNSTASGALISDRLSEDDISRGRFDGAEVTHWQVNWAEPDQRILMFRGELGEIRRGASSFEVELRGLSEVLNRPMGRAYLPVCDASLGDARCGFDLSDPAFSASAATVAAVEDARKLRSSDLGAYAANWFTDGVLTWRGGASDGIPVRVRSHLLVEGAGVLILDRDQKDMAAGDVFDIVAGCDKRKETCAAKFSNLVNFRGFPFMPGENWVTAYPVDGQLYQGGSRLG